jgi:membrane fusion protein (multidrug efflux system)
VGPDNTVERRLVETGRRRPGEVEITEGLEPGERVITEGTQKVRPGQQVVILPGSEE